MIAAYVYCADIYCPTCVVEQLLARGLAAPAAVDMYVEDVLDQIAGANAIDREDESSYDSDIFPKVLFSADVEDETCGSCGGEL